MSHSKSLIMFTIDQSHQMLKPTKLSIFILSSKIYFNLMCRIIGNLKPLSFK